MPNGIIGKPAVVVSTDIPNSKNLGKILTPISVCTREDRLRLLKEKFEEFGFNYEANEKGLMWFTDNDNIIIYTDLGVEMFACNIVFDSNIRTLPDLDEDEENEIYNELEKEKSL